MPVQGQEGPKMGWRSWALERHRKGLLPVGDQLPKRGSYRGAASYVEFAHLLDKIRLWLKSLLFGAQ